LDEKEGCLEESCFDEGDELIEPSLGCSDLEEFSVDEPEEPTRALI
jgi:hypothetical protein